MTLSWEKINYAPLNKTINVNERLQKIEKGAIKFLILE